MPEIGSQVLIVLLGNFALCWTGLWLMLSSGLTARLAVDQPNSRSLHVTLIPRVGGLVLMPVVLISWLVLQGATLMLVFLATGLATISYLDDRRGLSVAVRLSAHLCAAFIFVWVGIAETDVVKASLLVIAMVWMINLYNFMDGSDGLAGGMTVLGFLSYGVAALWAGDEVLSMMCFAVASAALAFLHFNFHPARIFLGDAGAIPLGFFAAALGLHGWNAGLWPLWFPVLVFAAFIADATATLAKRLLRGDKFWQAHREHYYQRLVRIGWGHRKTALVEYCLMAASGGSALALLHASSAVQVAALLLWCTLLAALMLIVDHRWRAHVAATQVAA